MDSPQPEKYDLVIIGSGITGLNALWVAKEYLPKGAKVLILDQKPTPGGMWNIVYDFVKLHQPYQFFTVGDLKWQGSQPRQHLADSEEIRNHLTMAFQHLSRSVNLEARFGHTVVCCDEVEGTTGHVARIKFHPNDTPEQVETVEADRAIQAFGLNYHKAKPLALSSDAVKSTIPEDLPKVLGEYPGAPVYVVGGGKTGMDVIIEILKKSPGRKIALINGVGTNFFNRTKYMPTGLKRWTSGKLLSEIYRDIALNFNGDNEAHTIAHMRRHYATDPYTPNGSFKFGFLSEEELAQVREGLSHTYSDYLAGVIDSPEGPKLTLRGGGAVSVERGSVFVNCTGSCLPEPETVSQSPCLSPHNAVLSIHPGEGFVFVPYMAAFLLTHLLYRGTLRGNGYYTLDQYALMRQSRAAWFAAVATLTYMNAALASQSPIFFNYYRSGLNLDHWYPLHRQLVGLLRMAITLKADIAHCRSALDRVAQRFGIHCAPL